MATLYIVLCRTYIHTAQIRTRIPPTYFYIGQESNSESVPESVSGNVNEPLVCKLFVGFTNLLQLILTILKDINDTVRW